MSWFLSCCDNQPQESAVLDQPEFRPRDGRTVGFAEEVTAVDADEGADQPGRKRPSLVPRQQTGYVKKEEIANVLAELEAEEAAEATGAAANKDKETTVKFGGDAAGEAAPPVVIQKRKQDRSRKQTGFLTKEQAAAMAAAQGDDDEDEEEGEGTGSAAAGDAKPSKKGKQGGGKCTIS
mmetsp:Transcript_102021/g.200083  ORF Transcript_102021/g.200083 Transcript_102021/m.200083 type:complete len:179 (-) Transcript_102021:82-618(-)